MTAVAVVVAALATVGMAVVSAEAVEDEPVGAMGTEGLVDTLAGPGHCPQAASETTGARQVRAVAADDDGRKVYDTGPPQAPVLVTVDRRGEVSGRVSGLPAPRTPSGAPPAVAAAPLAAGRLVADPEGALVVAAGSQLVRLAPGGERTTLAGDPTSDLGAIGPARSGDGGPAEQARFRSAASLAADGDGNLYVADHGGAALGHSVVRVINRSDEPHTFYADTADEMTVAPGDIATLAGTPPADDDEPAAAGDEQLAGRARQAVFHGATTLAVAGDRLYVASAADESSPQARLAMVNLAGQPLAAHGHTVEPGGLAVVAGGDAGALGAAGGVAVDGDDVYVADPARHRVVGLDGDGSVAIVAGAEGLGANIGGFDGNHQAPVGARLNRPVDVALGPEGGTVYVADRDNGQLRAVTPEVVIRGVAGAGAGLTWQCHPPPGADPAEGQERPARGGPASVAVDSDGAIYFALPQAHQVKRRTPDGTIHTVAGRPSEGCQLGCAGFAGDGGPARQAELDTPTAVALGPDEETLYVYDGGNARLRLVNLSDASVSVHRVTVEPGAIATVAGSGVPARGDSDGGGSGDSSARDARLAAVADVDLTGLGRRAAAGFGYFIDPLTLGGLAVDGDRTVFLAEPQHRSDGGGLAHPARELADDELHPGRLRRLAADGSLTTLISADTVEAEQCCPNPNGVAVTDQDTLYIADTATYRVWLYNHGREPVRAHGQTIAPGEAAAVAGTGDPGFPGVNAAASQSPLLPPVGVAVDGDTAYLAGLGILGGHDLGHYLHRLTADGTLDLVAGHGQPGFNGDLRRPRLTGFNLPAGLAVDPCGNLLVADGGNDRIRRLNLTGPCQPTAEQAAPNRDPGGLPVLAVAGFAGGAAALVAAGWHWHRYRQRSTARLPR